MNALASVPKPGPEVVAVGATMVSPSGVSYSVELVTPEKAEQWLTKNTNNRRLRKSSLRKYARDMAVKKWIENGSAISFGANGELFDGQHRLIACVDTGESFWSLVVRNLPLAAKDTIDDGNKRTLADRLDFHGEQNATLAASILRRILMWENGYKTNTGAWVPTPREMFDLLDDDITARVAIEAAVSIRSTFRIIPPTLVGLSYWLFWNIDQDAAHEFWDGLSRGAGLNATDARWVLREQMIDLNSKPGHISDALTLQWVIKAWNYWRDGREVKRSISVRRDEKFPEPH